MNSNFTTSFRACLAGLILVVAVAPVYALEASDVIGTWKLVASKSRMIETGEVIDTFGSNPKGWLTYGRDGRMMVLIVGGNRTSIGDPGKLSDPERARLFATMTAYAGTYSFDGDRVLHHIDTSWNKVWQGTIVTRTVRSEGNLHIYTTEKERGFGDNSPSVTTLTWQRMN